MADDQSGTGRDNRMTEEMTNYGITCVPLDNFYYREFHYTNLRDAIAQAKHDRRRLGLIPTA